MNKDRHIHKCMDCEREHRVCFSEVCIFEPDEDAVYDHCGCIEGREYRRELALENWAERLYETDRDPEEDLE